MGILDKMREIKDGLDDIKKDFEQLGEDLADIVYSGVSGGEIECASDICKEADNIIFKCNENYIKTHDNIEKKLLDLDQKREVLFQKKKKLAQSINYKIHLEIDIPVNIAPLKVNQPKAKKFEKVLPDIYKSVLYPVVSTRQYTISPQNIDKMFWINEDANLLTAGKRLENASEYRNRARDYKVKMDVEIAKLGSVEKCVKEIAAIFEEEEELLKIINSCLEKNSNLVFKNVAKELETLLVEAILDENGKENKKYKSAIEELKLICGNDK